MEILINGLLFLLLGAGFWLLVDWFWEVGVQEIVVHTEQFLLEETQKVRMQKLPEAGSNKLWDKLERLLFYSGIRNRYPFFSAKVWLLCMVVLCGGCFLTISVAGGTLGQAGISCGLVSLGLFALLGWLRRKNLQKTEKHLLELINLTESFAVTGEEPVAILLHCQSYIAGPMGQVLKNAEKTAKQGVPSRILLERMKGMLEHPKWQEFMHNLNVCSMYNSDFKTVFDSSRKSIQGYLSSKKERQKVKQVARIEMAVIVVFGMIILYLIGNMLEMSMITFLWGNSISRICTIYMGAIIVLFFRKLGRFEKE